MVSSPNSQGAEVDQNNQAYSSNDLATKLTSRSVLIGSIFIGRFYIQMIGIFSVTDYLF